ITRGLRPQNPNRAVDVSVHTHFACGDLTTGHEAKSLLPCQLQNHRCQHERAHGLTPEHIAQTNGDQQSVQHT
ncbi:MAG TPA: hypothetical protein VHK27_07470, partial [Gammaproteobacteria bacterium]|nr:hypothetical protein [Gammaproteobacteria bacterium]